MLEVSPPFLVQISAFGVKGMRMRSLPDEDTPPAFNRDTLVLPQTIITEFREDGNYQPIVAEQMNFLWNVFGFEFCNKFNSDGIWIGH